MTAAAVADRYLADLAATDGDAAALVGREPAWSVPQTSPDAVDSREQAARRAHAALAAVEPGDIADRTLAAALAERTASEIALYDSGFTPRLLAPLATPVHLIRETFDDLPAGTPDDWERIGRALAEVPAALAGYGETLRRAADRGQLVAPRQIAGVVAQCRAWIDPAGDDFYPRLVARADVPDPLRRRLVRDAAGATAATAAFADMLSSDLLPRATAPDAVGREMYAVTASAFLGSTVDLDDTYAWGWSELRRIRGEIAAVAATISPDGVQAAVAVLDADPAYHLRGSDALAGWLDSRMREIADSVDGVHFDLPPAARLPECRISAATSGVMYYTPPDALLTRPGRVFWTRPPGDAVTRTWREVTTVHHEGIPGHHLQTVTALTAPGLHPWQRALCHVHGYVEGWAHHVESYAGEIGLLRSPGERLGMLFGQAWRAARIVIDAGLHLDLPIPADNGVTTATRWTPEVGVRFLVDAAGVDERSARFEVDRYLGWPAQALAFRVGARLWAETLAAARAGQGDDFDARRFHTETLRRGPMGLGPMRDLVLGH
ncbi:DUF885 domain-containing protein [Nakamurella deserti]|uniref:DUF885 domain-containing protein n=1 Tax=Nakamurella deserti TaxID=2164074 RepID=UPI00197C91E1|nr:DUF885 domain-containing protein [Nakamurella deserti]